MLCNKCGAQIPDDSIFCTHCGTHLGYSDAENTNNTVNTENTVYEDSECVLSHDEQSQMAAEVLKWGILGAAFAEGVPFLGIPFSAKAKKLAAEYEFCKCKRDARVTVGKILGKVGFIVGLVLTIVLGVYFSICFTVIAAVLIGSAL